MSYLKLLMSPLGKALSLILLVLTAIGTVYTKGRISGKNAERLRSKKKVDKVQKKMDAETQKDLTDDELKKKLKNGTF